MMDHTPQSLDPPGAATMLASWGFLASPDLPDRPGPAQLLVALREEPTLHHYDPEIVEYWVTRSGRGVHLTLTHGSPMPHESDFSWGMIRILDRFRVSNEYLSFGGRLSAASVGGMTVIVFASPAPILRRGGHSQGWDHGAQSLGAFFGRIRVAVDYAPGFEAQVAEATPLVRYAAFVIDFVERYRPSHELRAAHPELWALLEREEARMMRDHPLEWTEGAALLATSRSA